MDWKGEENGLLDLFLTGFLPFNFKFGVKTEYLPESALLILSLFQTWTIVRAQRCGVALMKFYFLLNRGFNHVKQQL